MEKRIWWAKRVGRVLWFGIERVWRDAIFLIRQKSCKFTCRKICQIFISKLSTISGLTNHIAIPDSCVIESYGTAASIECQQACLTAPLASHAEFFFADVARNLAVRSKVTKYHKVRSHDLPLVLSLSISQVVDVILELIRFVCITVPFRSVIICFAGVYSDHFLHNRSH